MIDVYLASRIARTYGNRAGERGGSKARAGIIVFLTIIGTEIAVAVWVAGPTFNRAAALGGAALGWLLGAGIGSGIGGLLTRGPIHREPLEGRESLEPPLADPPRGVDRSTSGPSSSASLAGVECAQCRGEIVMRHQGTRCATCGDPVHGACAAAHRTKHFGPFRRAGGAP